MSDSIVQNDVPSETSLKEIVLQPFTNYQIIEDVGQTATNTIVSDDELRTTTNTVVSDDVPQTATNSIASDDAQQTAMDTINSEDFFKTATNTDISFEHNSTKISNLNDSSLNFESIPNLLDQSKTLDDTEVDISHSLLGKSPIIEKIEDHKIGDIVWAKIGKYPFWPSVICMDPKSKIYTKENKNKKNVNLHVRFCNDKGRRSWTKTIENYSGKQNLLLKYPNCLSNIKNSKNLMQSWNLAVEEADSLLKLNGEARMIAFFKTFTNSNILDCSTASDLNNSSENTNSVVKGRRTYSRKRFLAMSEQEHDSKIIKTENMSVNGSTSTSSKSIDIPLLSKSDDADSTVSDMSMNFVFYEDMYSKIKQNNIKKSKSTKTYPPKYSLTDKYDLSDSMGTSEYTDDISLPDNHDIFTPTSMTSAPVIPEHRKREISLLEDSLEEVNEDDTISLSRGSKRYSKSSMQNKNILNNGSQSTNSTISQSSKKIVAKNKPHRKSSTRRKSTTVKNESSPEPDTTESEASSKNTESETSSKNTESEASSKNDTYSAVFLASTKNKQLFIKSFKRACVVCKNSDDTVKCIGACQSFFHKDCLAKSEERYKSEPEVEKIKKLRRSKKHFSKYVRKNKTPDINGEKIEQEINEKNTTLESLNDTKSLTIEECVGGSNEDDKSFDQSTSDDLSKVSNCILTENEKIQEVIKSESVNENSIQETSDEKMIDILTKPTNTTNENIFKDDSKYLCSLCKANKTNCFVCGLDIEDAEQKIVCKLNNCGKYYHEKCLEYWPQCQWIQGSRNNVRCIVCPHHVCHLCISDNPKSSCKIHFPSEKLIRCIKCPSTYHRSEYCLPAGCEVLTYFDIICSRHFEPPKGQNYHYNATWCFICTLGGTLVCCDLCPSSFHIECLNQHPSEFENGFTCEECQTGRYPLYGEIVWVKIGNYRWWPAQIVFPNQVPDTINAIKHSVGQFAVRFFGSYDYYWVNRGRVFNFHEGDDENILVKTKMKVIDHVFQDAVIEAAQAHNAYILDKDKNDAIIAKKSTSKPPKFIRIKFNKPIASVKNMELDITPMTPCECDPFKPNPCGPGSDCLNRMLLFECQPQICPAGDKCNNQRFEKVLYPAMVPFLTKDKGWGLKTLEDIKEGSFVIEYVGDVIDEEEFKRRCLEMHKRNEQNYYFLTIDNSRMIDAGPRGNLSRFMNHSCEPNCVTQKWTVNGDTRIGLFALHDILAGTELVFDYRLQSCSGVEKKPCQCGAARCSRFIGVKVEEEKKKIIPINDTDKCKSSTKAKRKPLKIKDNVSDSEKSKLKVLNNGQNNSTTEKGVLDASDAEKKDSEKDSKKSKNKASVGKSPALTKNENSESSEKHISKKKKLKNSSINSTSITKDDITKDSLETDECIKSEKKSRNSLSKHPQRKQLIKDDPSVTDNAIVVKQRRRCRTVKKKKLIKTNLLPLPKISTKLLAPSTLYLSKNEDRAAGLDNIEDMKVTRKSTNNVMKTEKNLEILENASELKTIKSTGIQEKSRHSLSRLAKSRHSFLSKDGSSKTTIEKLVVPKKNINKEKSTTIVKKTKCEREIPHVRSAAINKNKLNKHSLLPKMYYKNDSCLICGKGHTELTCKNKKCPRVFHLSCMNKSRIVKSGFICPSHFCSICKKRKVVASCKFCVESFCSAHVKGNILKDPLGNGMLCNTHHPKKKPIPIESTTVTPNLNINSKASITNNNTEPVDFAASTYGVAITEDLLDIDEDQSDINLDKINEEKYALTQVIKDECDREYIHIGGFNVCNVSDLVPDLGESYTAPINTDGDLFKPSSANVVIDIESASAMYQPTDSLQLVSIATENKDCDNYANVHFIPDSNQIKTKWRATEP